MAESGAHSVNAESLNGDAAAAFDIHVVGAILQLLYKEHINHCGTMSRGKVSVT